MRPHATSSPSSSALSPAASSARAARPAAMTTAHASFVPSSVAAARLRCAAFDAVGGSGGVGGAHAAAYARGAPKRCCFSFANIIRDIVTRHTSVAIVGEVSSPARGARRAAARASRGVRLKKTSTTAASGAGGADTAALPSTSPSPTGDRSNAAMLDGSTQRARCVLERDHAPAASIRCATAASSGAPAERVRGHIAAIAVSSVSATQGATLGSMRCSAPSTIHTRLWLVEGSTQSGRCSAASMRRNSPSTSRSVAADPIYKRVNERTMLATSHSSPTQSPTATRPWSRAGRRCAATAASAPTDQPPKFHTWSRASSRPCAQHRARAASSAAGVDHAALYTLNSTQSRRWRDVACCIWLK